jgi:hypothetical protein
MVEDVLKALRVFDGREVAMERARHTMNNLKKHIFNLQNPPFNLLARIARTLEENFTKKWDMMLTDLHYAGALLNPYLNGESYRVSLERGVGSGERGAGIFYFNT